MTWLGFVGTIRKQKDCSPQSRRRGRYTPRPCSASVSGATFEIGDSETATLTTAEAKRLAKDIPRLLERLETGTATRDEKRRLARLNKGLMAEASAKKAEGTFMKAALREIGDGIAKADARRAEIRSVLDKLQKAEKVDLLFMVDCTGSMAPHINNVKDEVRNIAKQAMARSSGLDLQIGFLGYRDVRDRQRFERLDFTSSFDQFSDFLAGIDADGEGDSPEDIMGALQLASRWEWTRPTRVLVHVADCPCHGRRYHALGDDDFPDRDPNGIKASEVLTTLRKAGVDYYFGKLTSHTDKMISQFNKEASSVTVGRTKDADVAPYVKVLEASHLDEMVDGVSRSITDSISATFEVMSGHSGIDSAITVELASLRASTAVKSMVDVELDVSRPNWSSLRAEEALVFAMPPFRHVREVTDLSKGVIGIKRASPSDIGKGSSVWMKIAERPFAEGAQRYARWAQMGMVSAGSGRSARSMLIEWTDMVVKDFKKLNKKHDLPGRYAHQMENSAVASFLAQVYNKEGRQAGAKKIEILRSYVIETGGSYYALEKPLPSDQPFIKYSSNTGFWSPDDFNATLGDFCKWTFQATKGYLIVSDLQGVELEDRFILTDPAILCSDLSRFGGTNLGVDFMERVLKGLKSVEECGKEP